MVFRSATPTQRVPSRAIGFRIRDRKGHPIDFAPVSELLERIIAVWDPQQIWLFGSRARGDASPSSDWDFLAVLPDDSTDDTLDPIVSWRIRKDSGVRADIVPCRRHDFEEDRSTANTLAYEAATEGALIFER